ncbi:hypothetical protein XELAEV_18003733mg [Xenopus laevis]|uniref:Uncharacterized protein n=1 Tax=Xenopus laevis TaxID=8355 RepID=A0A974BNM2_XENLA|nr:hypothetical protein XELAEV_18003733mg [Xenopus laevis]
MVSLAAKKTGYFPVTMLVMAALISKELLSYVVCNREGSGKALFWEIWANTMCAEFVRHECNDKCTKHRIVIQIIKQKPTYVYIKDGGCT